MSIGNHLCEAAGATQVGWRAWQQHMDRLFVNTLAKLPLQVIWKEHTPMHFGGATGSETMCAVTRQRLLAYQASEAALLDSAAAKQGCACPCMPAQCAKLIYKEQGTEGRCGVTPQVHAKGLPGWPPQTLTHLSHAGLRTSCQVGHGGMGASRLTWGSFGTTTT